MNVRPRIVGDLAGVPTSGFRSHGLWFWGALGFMTIESAGFALAMATYLYLMALAPQWPLQSHPPDLTWGTALTILLLVSLVPTAILSRAARRRDAAATRFWTIVVTILNALALVLRGFEFPHLNTRWDLDAYGSATWALMLLHTVHLVTDFIDTAGLAAFLFMGREISDERFSDTDDDAIYWAYVVVSWLPIYALVYWAPRWVP
jgi:heme/copper-type cytochrome/quinol oxidase subunit 3